MKLLLHASQLKYNSRIYVFVNSIFPSFPLIYRQCLNVQYFAPTVRVWVFAHTRTNTVYVCLTYSDSTFAHTVSVSLLLHCNRAVHNFNLGLNWEANLKILL